MGLKNSILLVEDDPNLSVVLKDYLEMLGYETELCTNGDEGLKLFRSKPFDLCILDVMMPRKDGFTLARDIREENESIPIIFLTARALREDRVQGFKAGCDDYITKPFSTEELSLRIKAILKRCSLQKQTGFSQKPVFQIGNYLLDFDNLILKLNDVELSLTKKEAELLKLLCENQNKLVTREFALRAIWGSDNYFVGRSMDVFITRLRKYLKNDDRISITNVHGSGFKLEIKDQNL